MASNDEIIRVCSDLQFMRKLCEVILHEEDTFGYQMLQGRIYADREADRLAEERGQREMMQRQIEYEQGEERKDAL